MDRRRHLRGWTKTRTSLPQPTPRQPSCCSACTASLHPAPLIRATRGTHTHTHTQTHTHTHTHTHTQGRCFWKSGKLKVNSTKTKTKLSCCCACTASLLLEPLIWATRDLCTLKVKSTTSFDSTNCCVARAPHHYWCLAPQRWEV